MSATCLAQFNMRNVNIPILSDEKYGARSSSLADYPYFEKNESRLMRRNLIQEEIKRRINSGNACYHSVQNLLSSRLMSRNIKTRIYKTIILPVVLYGCETWSLKIGRASCRERVYIAV
jgi:hypothetical protein